MKTVYQEIQKYIDGQKQEMLTLWETLVNTESGTKRIEGVNQIASILQHEMEKVGMDTRQIPVQNAGNLLTGTYNPDSSNRPLLFIGHMDTVFPDGTVEKNPFRIDQEGKAYGPGVLDMKGGLVIALYAVKALKAVGWIKRPVKMVFASDEENLHMNSDAKAIIAKECQGAVAAFNFETGYLDDRLVVGRNGGGPVKITIHGRASHSGIAPEKGRSAILEAASKILEIEKQNDIPRGRLINCGVVSGGIGENTIPDNCTIRIGIRFPNTEIRDEIYHILQEAVTKQYVPDVTSELDLSRVMECMDTTKGVSKLFQYIKKTAIESGYGNIESFRVGGLSDSGITVAHGIPTVCGMGVKGTGNHTASEYAEVESLFKRCVLAASATYGFEDQYVD